MSNEKVEVLFENKWVQVLEKTSERGSYTYTSSNWCGGEGVAILPFKKSGDGELDLVFLGRYEVCPAHSNTFDLCSITGGMDKDGEPAHITAQRELLEESGYNAELDRFTYLGNALPSKQSSNIQYLFAVDVTGLEQQEIVGDGTMGEDGAYVKWHTIEEIVKSEDPLISMMIIRSLASNIF